MTDSVNYGGLTVAKELDDFLRNEVIDGIAVDPDQFWSSLESVPESLEFSLLWIF